MHPPLREQQGSHLSPEEHIHFSCQRAVFLRGAKEVPLAQEKGKTLNSEEYQPKPGSISVFSKTWCFAANYFITYFLQEKKRAQEEQRRCKHRDLISPGKNGGYFCIIKIPVRQPFIIIIHSSVCVCVRVYTQVLALHSTMVQDI